MRPVALYVHVPFCRSICPYCDFAVYAGRVATGPRSRVTELVEALHAELELRGEATCAAGGERAEAAEDGAGEGADATSGLRSVYLGGGTPSLLSPGAVAGLLEHVDRSFGIERDAEISLEANPGDADRGDLAGFRAAGVTRLSIGAQSLDDSELRALGRRHRSMDVATAVRQARDAGFDSLSLDLLYDIPGQTIASWQATLERVRALEPDHISTYALTLELEGIGTADHLPAGAGALAWRRRAVARQDEDRAAAMDTLADEILEPAGWQRYEIANRARSGHQSRHNLVYWRSEPYEAIGPGAHRFDGMSVRGWNDAGLDGYLSCLRPAAGSPQLPPGGVEELDSGTAEAERLMLALRLCDGIDALATLGGAVVEPIRWGLEVGVLESWEGRLRLTPRGRLISNELFLRLLPAPSGQNRVEAAA